MKDFNFKILKKSSFSLARISLLETPHGQIFTPAFIPVATQGVLKGLSPKELENLGVQILLVNTYHLYLRPGPETIEKLGGIFKFMGWRGPLMTDSGGFQIFSLGKGLEHGIGKIIKIFPEKNFRKKSFPKLVRIFEEGVLFISHLDGSKHFFTPEKSIEVQAILGADFVFAFDECTSPFSDYKYTQKALQRTHRWAKRSLEEFERQKRKRKTKQAIFGVLQGGEYRDLREKSAKFMRNLDFFGFGIGGSLGKSKKQMFQILEWTLPLLPQEKPRHLLGIGRPEDIKESVKRGVDLFDCVWPTRIARRGTFIISEQKTLKITKKEYKESQKPIQENCPCYCCQNFTRAYLHYLFKTKETLAFRLATLHNLTFMINFMKKIRKEIKKGKI